MRISGIYQRKYTLMLDPDLADRLDEVADMLDISKRQLMIRALNSYIRKVEAQVEGYGEDSAE